jgi:hypothetical protein
MSSRVQNPGEVVISGSFAPNGSSAVDAASNRGTGFSVARTSTGLFTVTLQDSFLALNKGDAHLQLASGDDKIAQLGSIDVVTAKTVQIRVWDISGAAVADVAADENNRIHFELRLRNTTITQ